MSISKRIRFEVFKRDGFICQYCGKYPPEVILEVDHIKPISSGGTDDINNIITACFSCNRGKSNKLLSSIPKTLRVNLRLAKEREKQIDEYYKYLAELELKKELDVAEITEYFFGFFDEKGAEFTASYKASLKMFLKFFNKYQIKGAIDIAIVNLSKKRNIKDYDVFKYMCGVLHNWRKKEREDIK